MAFVDAGDLRLYDLDTRRARRLTFDGNAHRESMPLFLTDSRLAFVRDGDLVRLDLRSGRLTRILRGPVLAYAPRPGTDAVAVLAQPGGSGSHVLWSYRVRGARRTELRRFALLRSHGDAGGRSVDDMQSVVWSPNGRKLLVVDTAVSPRLGTLHVLSPGGRDLISTRRATHAGWLGSSKVFFRDLGGAAWFLLDARSGARTKLPIRRGRMHPAPSPNGRYLALDDGRSWKPGTRRRGCTCTLLLYDVARHVERPFAAHAIGPLWVSNRRLVATRVRACAGGECGADVPMWVPLGRTSLVDVRGAVRPLRGLRTTLDAAVTPSG